MKLIKTITFLVAHLFTAAIADDNEIRVDMSAQSMKLNNTDYLVLSYKNASHWHTYWENPGDAGIPVSAKFKVNGKDIKIPHLEYPAPRMYLEKGKLLGYGFEGEYALFFPISNAIKKSLEGKQLDIHSEWLVCKHLCVPGEKNISGKFESGKFKANTKQSINWSNDKALTHLNALPKKQSWPKNLSISLSKGSVENSLYLYYCLLYTSPSPRDQRGSRMPSSA